MSAQLNSRAPQSPRLQFEELRAPGLSGNGLARRGRITTAHGVIETPIFMPVGTAGTVKGIMPRDLLDIGSQIILGNTYHLWLRPGTEILRTQGGLRPWMKWPGPLLTDSGGFQVFSMSELRRIKPEGVHFKSHLDGSALFLSPEKSIEIQEAIASTIMMVLDVCPELPSDKNTIQEAVDMSTAWAKRCLGIRKPESGALFAIVQGGLHRDLRKSHLEELTALQTEDSTGKLQQFDGYALGGLSVGEAPEEMWSCVADIAPLMPRDRPRYLMGVGTPTDLLNCVANGIDMFDCVMPTRNARNGTLFTWDGAIHIRNAKYANDSSPLDAETPSYVSQNFTRSYVRHLHQSNEILGKVLSSIHNLAFYLDLMKRMREAIEEQRFEEFRNFCLKRWRTKEEMLKNGSCEII